MQTLGLILIVAVWLSWIYILWGLWKMRRGNSLNSIPDNEYNVCVRRRDGILYAYDCRGAFIEQDRDWGELFSRLMKQLTPPDQTRTWGILVYQQDKDTTFIVKEQE